MLARLFFGILILTVSQPLLAQGTAADSDAKQAELEKQLAEKLSGATLVGSFTVDGKNDKPPRPERYELGEVKKLHGTLWLFTTRIKYGQHDVQVPLTIDIRWASETPVITLDDMTIPGLGSEFGARVLFHGDRYVGTWSHGKVGGHMFGNIEPKKAEGQVAPATEAPANP